MGANGVHEVGVGGDVASHHPEGLAQRTLDDVDLVGHAVALGHAAAAYAVEAHRVDLVQVGHGAVFLGQGGRAANVGDVAVHGIDALEGHQLGRVGRRLGQQAFQVFEVVVAEDLERAPAVADAGDHGGVVQLVGEHDQAGQHLLQRRQGRLIGDVAGGEEKRRLLAVQVGQLALELDVVVRGAGDVARAA